MILSFAYTEEAALSRRKTVTRRYWKHGHAARFMKLHVIERRPFLGYSRLPIAGGLPIFSAEAVSLRQEPLRVMRSDPAYEAEELLKEGGLWERPEYFYELFEGRRPKGSRLWRIEFRVLCTLEEARAALRLPADALKSTHARSQALLQLTAPIL